MKPTVRANKRDLLIEKLEPRNLLAAVTGADCQEAANESASPPQVMTSSFSGFSQNSFQQFRQRLAGIADTVDALSSKMTSTNICGRSKISGHSR